MLDVSPPLPNGQIVDWDRARYDADTTRERSTRLKAMLDPRGPRAYWDALHPKEKELTGANAYQLKVTHFTLGILFHEWILDGEINWIPCEHNRRSKAWERFVTRNRGKTIVSPGQDKELREWREALMENPIARKLVEDGGFREQVIIWDECVEFIDSTGATGEMFIPCKAALDSLDFNGNVFCIKTTAATNRDEWERELRKWHYDFSAAFYDRGRRAVPHFAGTSATFTHLVVMKGSTHTPARCYQFELGQDWLEIGDAKVRERALQRLAKCRDAEELIRAEGGDVREAYPDDIAATQADPMTPRQRDFEYQLEACQR